MRSFHDKIIALTGAASGIGRALAKALAARGARLALADRDAHGLAQTRQALGNAHVTETVLDVSDRAAMTAWAEASQAAFGAVHGLISNAGATFSDRADIQDPDQVRWLMDVNFFGTVYGVSAFLPAIQAAGDGLIVNLSSIFGIIGYPGQSAYCASKFAVRGYTETLRMDLADTKVQIVSVHPGGVKTNIIRNARYHRGADGQDGTDALAALFDRNAPTSAERAAEIILAGVEAGRTRILVGPDAKRMDLIQRLFPVRYGRILGRMIK